MDEPVKPIMDWNSEEAYAEGLAWWSRLDDRYQVEVHRTGEYAGHLYIWDHEDGMLLHDREVGLSYGARFGPDVSDVAGW